MCLDGLRRVRKSGLRLVISIGWKRKLLVTQRVFPIFLSENCLFISEMREIEGEMDEKC